MNEVNKPHLLLLSAIFPMEIQPFVTSHVQAMLQRGWRVTIAARQVDAKALASFCQSNGPLEVHELRPQAEALAQRKGLGRHIPILRRFGPSFYRVFGFSRNKKRAAESCVLYDIASKLNPDVIHAHFGGVGLLASPVARALGKPLFVSFHGEELKGHESEAPPSCYRRAMHGANAVVYSQYMHDIASSVLDCPIHRVQFGVPQSTFKPQPRAAHWADVINLLIVGRLIDYKGQDVAIRALKLLRAESGRDFQLTLVGDGPQRAEFEALARESGVTPSVHFAGTKPQAEVAEIMRKADILLVTSGIGITGWQETFCLAALEGMCCGLPIIATRTGALPDTVANAGPLIPHGDPRALADAILATVADYTPEELSRRSLVRAADFDYETMGESYDQLARNAL